jgi:hypothetical protein
MLETIATLISLCKESLAGLKWVKEKYDARTFTPEQTAILKAAAQSNGIIQIVTASSLLHVFAGSTMFDSDSDPSYGARHLDAFAELCGMGLITHHGGEMFCLNGKGFDVAKNL